MSSFEVTTLTCPRCAQAFEAGTAQSLNVTRMPWAREQILRGTFHRVTCTHCGLESHLERPFLYTDLGRGHFVMVENPLDLGAWERLEAATDTAFHEALATGPSGAYELSGRFAVRVVFGLRGLVDKLRIWDAGLDDGVVEVLKLELFTQTPELRTRPDVLLSVTAVDDAAGRLEIEATAIPREGLRDDGRAPPSLWGASLARYHELAAVRLDLAERYPGLFFRPFACWRRLAYERVTPRA